MIKIKNNVSIKKMHQAGQLLAEIFDLLKVYIKPGLTTLDIDTYVAQQLRSRDLVSKTKGYKGYQHVTCVSMNDEVVHGVPRNTCVVKDGDLVKVDICASWNGYCADAARAFTVGAVSADIQKLVTVASQALDKGIEQAIPGNKLSDISSAIQKEVERHGFGVIRDFAGHGIGKQMHEDPEILNYGEPGQGPILRPGMTFAIEPMITIGGYDVYVTGDGWTVKTSDKSLATHVEDTIAITQHGPIILTRHDQVNIQ